MTRVSVELLGTPRLLRDGEPVATDTRKATALLAYLAVTAQPQTRDGLADLLWPDALPERGRGALRRTLSALRSALPELDISADRRTIALAPSAVRIDVERFNALLARARAHPCGAGQARPDSDRDQGPAPGATDTNGPAPGATDTNGPAPTGHAAAAAGGRARRLAPPTQGTTVAGPAAPPGSCPDCLAALEEAVALHRGPFLADFWLPDAPGFEEWRLATGEALRRALTEALEALIDGFAGRGLVARALPHAERLLHADELYEPAHRRLMLLCARAGDRARAVQQYRTCVRTLDRELGVEPLPETTAVYLDVVEGRVSGAHGDDPTGGTAPHAPAGGSRPAGGADGTGPAAPRLVGRDADLDRLEHAYEQLDDGALVIIEGEAGIGKTRLAEELVGIATGRGDAVLTARCYEAERELAFAPVVSLLHGAVDRLGEAPPAWLAEAARLLPGLADTPATGDLDAPGARTRFLEAIAELLTYAAGGEAPGLLLVDDMQWADGASLDVLGYLARRLPGRAMCVALCWRPDVGQYPGRIRQLVADAGPRATVVSPARLSVDDIAALVADLAPGAATAAEVHADTDGLPLLVVTYLQALARGELATGDDALPVGVREVLSARLAPLSPIAAQTAAGIAVIGRAVDVGLLAEVAGRNEEEIVAALEELLASGIVAERLGGGEYELAHPRLRALAAERMSLARRRLLHRRVAEALATRTHRDPGLAGVAAGHWQAAGRDAEAIEAHTLAAAHARRVGATSEALEHLDAALGLGPPDPSALHREVGDLHVLAGAYGAALRAYETGAALADDAADLGRCEHRLGVLHQRRGDWSLAARHLDAAATLLEDASPGQRARLIADRSLTAHRLGAADDARTLARQALRLAEQDRDASALAQTRNLLGLLAAAAGDDHTAQTSFEHAAAAAQHADPAVRAAALNNLALAVGRAGEPDRAISLAETAARLCVELGDRHREAAVRNNLADLLHQAGRETESQAALAESVRLLTAIGEPGAWEPEIWKLVEW